MGWLTAALYDRLTEATEQAGLATMRRELLAGLRGTVVEIGAGTGRNLEHYPDAVERVVVVEPDAPMARRLRARAGSARFAVDVAVGTAERIPLADGVADAVVSTLVLCTVDDVGRSLAEVERVLRPGGRFVFLEHVRADDARLARRQDRLAPLWRLAAGGCHLNRATLTSIATSGLELVHVEHTTMPGGSPLRLVDSLVVGSAVAPGAGRS